MMFSLHFNCQIKSNLFYPKDDKQRYNLISVVKVYVHYLIIILPDSTLDQLYLSNFVKIRDGQTFRL